MSFRSRVAASLRALILTEAIGSSAQVDPDDDLFSPLTKRTRDLRPLEHARMLQLASYLFQHNGLARRIIEIQRDFVVGAGLTVHSDDPDIDAVVKRFWAHPVNNWAVKGEQRFVDLRLLGEMILRVEETPGTGTVLLYPIDPSDVVSLEFDSTYEPSVIEVTSNVAGARRERLAVIRYDPTRDGFAADTAGLDGAAFFFTINRLSTSVHGVSELFALIDYLDGADQLLWAQLERARIANSMVFDVSIKNGQQPEIDAEIARIRKNPPRPGTVNVHSDSIIWQMLTPELGATENETMARQLLRWVLGSAGLPEHYFAAGDQANRATAAEMNDPVTKRMTAVQTHWFSVLDTMLRYQYDRACAHDSWLPRLSLEDPSPWTISTPDMSSKDVGRVGSVVGQVIAAIEESERAGYISNDTARVGALNVLKMLGIDSDPQAEAEAIAKQPKLQTIDYAKTPPAALARAFDRGKPLAPKPETATEGGFASAIVALWLRPDAASALAVDGGLRPQDLHITLAFLGDAAEVMFRRDALLVALRDFAATQGPVFGTVSGDGAFAVEDGPTPFYASFDSPVLPSLREALVTALEAAGFPVDRTHGFTPHITLAYVAADQPRPRRDVLAMPLLFDAVTVAIGPERYSIPLGESPATKNVTSVAEAVAEVGHAQALAITKMADAVASRPAPVVNVAPADVRITAQLPTEPQTIERRVVEYDERGRPVKSIETRK